MSEVTLEELTLAFTSFAGGGTRPKTPFVIDRIALTMEATVPGIDDAKFQELAAAAKRDCPLSKALAGVPEITLVATLK